MTFLVLIKEELKAVLAAMNKLTDQQRTAYTLSKVESYSNKEIAAILSLSLSATEALIKRAKQKLLEELKKTKSSAWFILKGRLNINITI